MKLILLTLLLVSSIYADIALTPDGTYVEGQPTLTPNGNYVGSSNGEVQLTPDGTYIGVYSDTQYIPTTSVDTYNFNNETNTKETK